MSRDTSSSSSRNNGTLFTSPSSFSFVSTATTSNLFTSNLHSWFGKSSHVVRADGRVLRARIGRVTVSVDKQVGVDLLFRDQHKALRKTVSPMFIAALRILWLNRDIVSEEEEDDKDDDDATLPTEGGAAPLSHIPDFTLPPLILNNAAEASLPVSAKGALEFAVRQTDTLQNIL